MAGHSHWAGIKRQKESNPDFNPRLRSTIEKARGLNVPEDDIQNITHNAIHP